LLAAASARYRTTSRALLVTQTALVAGLGEPASADEALMAEAVVAATCGALVVEAAATEEFAVGSAPVEAAAAVAMDVAEEVEDADAEAAATCDVGTEASSVPVCVPLQVRSSRRSWSRFDGRTTAVFQSSRNDPAVATGVGRAGAAPGAGAASAAATAFEATAPLAIAVLAGGCGCGCGGGCGVGRDVLNAARVGDWCSGAACSLISLISGSLVCA
jgi:hypothetical protein